MVERLERWQQDGDLHFVTFSCWHRMGFLAQSEARDLFERSLETTRARFKFAVVGYVVMPEHVHLLLSEPAAATLSLGLQSLKQMVTRRSQRRPFWQPRYYDFNVRTDMKRIEKLNYIHWNPAKRGLVHRPEEWRWSSCQYYQTGRKGNVSLAE